MLNPPEVTVNKKEEPGFSPRLRFPHTMFDADARRWQSHANKLDRIFEHVTNWSCAIDAGAWAGWWSHKMAERFLEVWAFEPIAVNAAIFKANNPASHVHLVQAAVSDHNGFIKMAVGGANYGKSIAENRAGFFVQCCTIDTLNLNPGLIKLDLEGLDLEGLKGAEATIKRAKPVICVEVKDRRDGAIQAWLKEHGYTLVFESRPDEVWVHADQR